MNLLKDLRRRLYPCAHLLLAGILGSSLVPECIAQNGTGRPKYSPVQQQIDTIDLATLNIHLDIPIFRKPQRGAAGDYGWHLTYDSNAYPTPGLGSWNEPGWHLQNQFRQVTGSLIYYTSADPCPSPYNGIYYTYLGFVFIDTDNTSHSLNDLVTTDSRDCGGTLTTATGRTADGLYTVSVSGGILETVVDPSGVTSTRDTNGNSLRPAPPSALSNPDNTGVVLTYHASYFPNVSTSSETFGYTDSNGTPQSVQITYQQVNILAYEPSMNSNPIAGPWTTSVPANITYSDGSSYAFTYEPTPNHPGYVTGRLASIKLPTGGLISYTYFGGAGNDGYINDAISAYTTAGLTRTTSDGTTTYTRTALSGDPWTLASQMGVATTLIHDPQGNETMVDSAYGGSQYFETRRRVYSGAATGTPLSTTTKCYNGATGDCTAVSAVDIPILSVDTRTSLNGGASSRTVQTYNASGQPTDLVEYDNGASNPTRHTIIHYATLGNNIFDRPSSVTVQDGGGHQISHTTYEYDQYSLTSTSPSLPGHEVVSGDRGNMTTTHRWVNTTDTTIDTHYHYDDAGQIVSSTDGRGNTTNFGYDPATDNCMISTTLPTPSSGVPQSFTQSCDTNTTLVTSSTDPNGTITAYGYDSMLRPGSTTVTSGGGTVASTTIAYSGGALPQTITTTVKATPGSDQITTTTLDPYGRISSTVDPIGATVLTTYDSLGRVGSVTNPYFSTSDPTYGVTGYAYDVLNRMTMQCQPGNGNGTIVPCIAGNSYKKWTYSGNTVSERDERGNLWQRTIDAFGNITSVLEPGSFPTSYSYSALGNLTNVTQHGVSGEAARTRSFVYDSLSRLTNACNPESLPSGQTCDDSHWSTGYVYDENSNLKTKNDPRGTTTTYNYDALNRLVSKTYSGGSAAATRSSCYQYDTAANGIGRLGADWTQAGTCPSSPPNTPETRHTIVIYDAMGRINEEQQCHRDKCSSGTPTTSTMHYDLAGNLTYYSGGVGSVALEQTYAAGRLQSINSSVYGPQYPSYPATLLSVGAYSPTGSIQNMNLGPVLNITRTYDSSLHLTGQTATHP